MVFFQTVHCFSEKEAVLEWSVSSSRQTQGRNAPMPDRRDTLGCSPDRYEDDHSWGGKMLNTSL